MRDYAEQVKALRICGAHNGCDGCPYSGKHAFNDCADVLNLDAADAIEELLAAVPKWISVEERLPEAPYGCLLIVWDSLPCGGDDFLNLLPYFAGWDGEQWNDGDGEQVPFEVVFWMPIPAPPKEDAE